MKSTMKQLMAASLLALAGVAANAGTITAHPGETHQGLTLVGGTAVLSFSSSLLAALDVGKVAVTAITPAAVIETTMVLDGETVRESSQATAPLSYLKVDDVTGDVLAAGSTGGAKMVAPKAAFISSGGSLSVANLSVNLVEKRVYADITGNFTGTTGGAVTTISNFHLWDYATITGPTNVQVGAGSFTNVISGLTITGQGLTYFSSALGLLSLGRGALEDVTDFGSITSTIQATGTLVLTPQVPEPGTWALMVVGLGGVMLAARRRRAA